MTPQRQIGIAIPTWNRYALALEAVSLVIDDPRVGQIVFVDDKSTDGSCQKLADFFSNNPKIKVYQNDQNLDCYLNKRQAVKMMFDMEWTILFDDDNILRPDYLDALYALDVWSNDTIYAPVFAEPHFNYTAFSGQLVTRSNVRSFLNLPNFKTALNTCNFFVRRDSFLQVFDDTINPHTSDSIFIAYNWLRWGGDIYFTPGLQYFHRVHDGSHYKANHRKTGSFAQEVELKLAQLK
jgi:glycosyltransferase involved in cell wall biosynthesis